MNGQAKDKLRATIGSVNDDLLNVAIDMIRKGGLAYHEARDVYDRIVSIHEARKAVRIRNRRKRGKVAS